MTLVELLLTIVVQVLFCGGLRVLLSDGQILHFIRKPFEYEEGSKIMNFLRERLRKKVLISANDPQKLRKKYQSVSAKIGVILKPFILCIVCFSSVWGGSVFIALHGFLPIPLFISCVSTAFILKIINDHVEF